MEVGRASQVWIYILLEKTGEVEGKQTSESRCEEWTAFPSGKVEEEDGPGWHC